MASNALRRRVRGWIGVGALRRGPSRRAALSTSKRTRLASGRGARMQRRWSRFPVAQVDEPIHRTDHYRAADDVAQRYRNKVADKVSPGQRRKIGGRLADGSPE